MANITLGEFRPTLNERIAEQRKLLNEIASGKRVSSTRNDPAAFAIASRISGDSTALSVAANNTATAQAVLATASSGLEQNLEVLNQLRTTAAAALSGAASAGDLANLNAQFVGILDELNGIASSTAFSGQNLLDGSSPFGTGVSVQVGPGVSDTISFSTPNSTVAGLGLTGINVSTAANASAALAAIDNAVNSIIGAQSQIGALSNQFVQASDLVATSQENALASISALTDADIGEAVTGQTNNALLTQASIAALSRRNAQRTTLLSLLQ